MLKRQLTILSFATLASCQSGLVALDPLPKKTTEYALTVSGSGPERARIALRGGANKVVVTSDDAGHFVAQIPLAPGQRNRISASLADEAASETISEVEQISPDVTEVLARRVVPPPARLADERELVGDRLVLRGTVQGASAVEIEGGADVITTMATAEGKFIAEIPLLRATQATLSVRSVDRFGNRSEPISIAAPEPLAPDERRAGQMPLDLEPLTKTIGQRLTLRGKTAPGARIELRQQDNTRASAAEEVVGYADAGGHFAVGVRLKDGLNDLTVSATSASGVSSRAEQVQVEAAAAETHASKYPIVLVHGMGGFDSVFGYEYWWGVEDYLKKHGFEVLVVEMTSLGTIERRSQQLLNQVRAYTTGKVNLIGHSQGCLDIRHMAATRDASQIASISLIAGPHRGSRVADVALGLLPGAAEAAIDALLRRLGWDWNIVRELSERNMVGKFNKEVRDVPGLMYQSWTGAADPFGWNTGVDLSAYLFPSWLVLKVADGDDSDGLVTVPSAKWGRFRGIMQADHVTEVGQIAGYTNGFDHKKFYLDLARELASQGY